MKIKMNKLKILKVNRLRTYEKILSNGLILLFMAALFVLPANAVLQEMGPPSTGAGFTGFPTFFRDTTGVPVAPCLGVNPDGTGLEDPLCAPFLGAGENPALPIAFPGNFPEEFFYWIATTEVATPDGSTFLAEFALEGAFA